VQGGELMMKQELALEVTECTLMESGDVLISPMRGRAIFVTVLGLLLALVGLWMLISDPLDRLPASIIVLALGGLLSYVGVRALTAPEISIEVANRLIHVRARGSQSTQTRPFDALVVPVNVTTMELGFPLVRAGLRFDDGRSLSLFATGDKKKAQEIIRWLEEAFSTSGVVDPVDAEV
jgi:hypothetical protein